MSDHVTLVTQRRPLRLAREDANTTVIAAGTDVVASTTTQPANATGRIVVPGVLNYLCVCPLMATGTTTPSVRVIGWSRLSTGLWVPRFLAKVGLTLNSTAVGSFFGASLLAPHTLSLTKGDAKLLGEEVSNDSNGWFIVDTVGSELVEIILEAASGTPACNAIISEV